MSICYGGGIAHTLSFKCVENWHDGADAKLGRFICKDCGNEIDPDCCHCGDDLKSHGNIHNNHSFVAMGCKCGYSQASAEVKHGNV
jgi:predicted amidophosphoribosyltransferase